MSEIKALEELRNFVSKEFDEWRFDRLNEIANAIQAEVDEQIDALRKQRDDWFDTATDIYRRFYSHEEYGIPNSEGIRDMVLKAVDERYMLLPVDADGVPIHVGDEMECHGDVFKVCAIAPAKIHRWAVAMSPEKTTTYSYDPNECTHYKPRTLEDVLCDFANDVAKQGHQIGLTAHGLSEKYAAEIRELLGVVE